MSEEPTDRLEGGTPFETHVLRALEALSNRLNALEGKVDARLRETRPIWEAVLSRLDSMDTRFNGMDTRLDSMDARLERMETRLERVDDKFDTVAEELLDMRTEIKRVKKRLPAA